MQTADNHKSQQEIQKKVKIQSSQQTNLRKNMEAKKVKPRTLPGGNKQIEKS